MFNAFVKWLTSEKSLFVTAWDILPPFARFFLIIPIYSNRIYILADYFGDNSGSIKLDLLFDRLLWLKLVYFDGFIRSKDLLWPVIKLVKSDGRDKDWPLLSNFDYGAYNRFGDFSLEVVL